MAARCSARAANEKEASTRLFSKRADRLPVPSAWFTWHARIFGKGKRVLDLACGSGRHAIPAAELGSQVVAVDDDADAVKALEREAERRKLDVQCLHLDLRTSDIEPASFDIVMLFNYLDRKRMPDFRAAVRPGGYLLAESFLESQREQGWGPQSEEHLLKPGELGRLVQPFDVFLCREVIDMVDGRPAAIASILAERPRE